MTFEQFDKFQAQLLTEVVKMKDTKGREYTNSVSRFANFDRLAAELGLTNTQIAWVYLVKHLDSLKQYIRTGKTYSTEPIQGRIVDAITYLTLIAGMIEEVEANQKEVTEQKEKIDDNSPLSLRPTPFPYGLVGKVEREHQPFEFDPTPEGK
jgi:hypothetical protein